MLKSVGGEGIIFSLQAEEMAVDYDLASKVAPAMGFGDLNVTHLQAIVIAHVGVQHEAEVSKHIFLLKYSFNVLPLSDPPNHR